MSGTHKYPTISFRISPRERRNRSKDFHKRHEEKRLFCPFLHL